MKMSEVAFELLTGTNKPIFIFFDRDHRFRKLEFKMKNGINKALDKLVGISFLSFHLTLDGGIEG